MNRSQSKRETSRGSTEIESKTAMELNQVPGGGVAAGSASTSLEAFEAVRTGRQEVAAGVLEASSCARRPATRAGCLRSLALLLLLAPASSDSVPPPPPFTASPRLSRLSLICGRKGGDRRFGPRVQRFLNARCYEILGSNTLLLQVNYQYFGQTQIQHRDHINSICLLFPELHK